MELMPDSSTILVFTSTEDEEPFETRRTRGGFDDFVRKTADRAVEVSTESLKRSVLHAYRNCMQMIQELPENPGAGVLETVTFSLAINGAGQVGLLSTSAKVATEVGFTFQVRIKPPSSGS
jgi:hypothetical protein